MSSMGEQMERSGIQWHIGFPDWLCSGGTRLRYRLLLLMWPEYQLKAL